jgi:hypothetical protein
LRLQFSRLLGWVELRTDSSTAAPAVSAGSCGRLGCAGCAAGGVGVRPLEGFRFLVPAAPSTVVQQRDAASVLICADALGVGV